MNPLPSRRPSPLFARSPSLSSPSNKHPSCFALAKTRVRFLGTKNADHRDSWSRRLLRTQNSLHGQRFGCHANHGPENIHSVISTSERVNFQDIRLFEVFDNLPHGHENSMARESYLSPTSSNSLLAVVPGSVELQRHAAAPRPYFFSAQLCTPLPPIRFSEPLSRPNSIASSQPLGHR